MELKHRFDLVSSPHSWQVDKGREKEELSHSIYLSVSCSLELALIEKAFNGINFAAAKACWSFKANFCRCWNSMNTDKL